MMRGRTKKRHTAAPSTTFGTVMNYVSLRLLGLDPDERVMQEICAWIHEHGNALPFPPITRRDLHPLIPWFLWWRRGSRLCA